VLRRIFFLLLVNALLFSVLGGALLTRYLLPMYPLVLLVAVSTFYRRVPYWQGLAVFSAAAFVLGLFVNPPYGFAPEDNLAYAHVVRLHQAGIAQLEQALSRRNRAYRVADDRRADAARAGLREAAVGRVPVDDFTAGRDRARRRRAGEVLGGAGFSTKYDPPPRCRV
jgi:4-amino-4-deoxy-L-arabinose transferase-like glycosyltransferase